MNGHSPRKLFGSLIVSQALLCLRHRDSSSCPGYPARYAGCCCVMQWNAPKPQNKSTA